MVGRDAGRVQVRLLYAGQFLTHTAAWFRNVAVALLLVQLTGGAAALGWVAVAQFSPILLLGTLPGRLVVRLGARTVLLISSGIAALSATLLLLTPDEAGWIALVYAVLAAGGVGQSLERPAAFGLTADLLGEERVGPALARHTTMAAAGRFAGPALAGFAYDAGGATLCFAVAIGLAIATMGLVGVIRTPVAATGGDRLPVDGLVSARRRLLPAGRLRWVLVVSSLVTLTAMSFNVTVTAMITISFGAGSTALGLAHMLNAAGAVAGGWAVSARGRVGPAALGPAATLLGVAIIVAALAGTSTQFLAFSFVLGLSLGWYQGTLQRGAQVAGGVGETARTAALVNLSTFGLAPLASLWSGYAVDAFSAPTAMVIAGCGALFAGLVALVVLRRSPSSS